ncbi:hypothetical protein GUITHDRAFT_133446 [Guillardia theta CCMP2712]|uniref:FAST kinase leucine-rich domain-containing protein n=1 Tax=Guillardia theta (strain CCMP2712) TaxID=905079 RepID=L1JY87_GUITC|nr:hypothetical protein GUITHDRAFT_133446 [Guillardia theta CCMP2712]EKX53068.1 hypothetical protein GUITHDRAFT_133446 [Guillardia theta CCMP2712]|eukprot:XP_005840048.1 hypothetical protein GUITHDRAFT_133446 [Guillardia theta CCMP2712]
MEVMQQVSVRLQNIQGEVLSPLDISNIAWSFGNVGYQDVDCMSSKSKQSSLGHCEDSIQGYNTGFKRAGRDFESRMGDGHHSSNLFDKAKKGLLHPSSQLSRYSPQSISNIVWALAKCNEINDDILQMFSDHVMKVGLSSFKVKDVCLLIHGYSNSNVGYELFEALVPWLQQIGLQQLTEDQITSFSWVLANRLRVRQVPNTGTKQLSQNSRYSHSSLDPLDESFGQHKEDIAELQLMMLIRTWVLSNPLKGFRSKDLSLLVWSFAVSFPMEKLILFPVNECLRSQDISTFSTLSLVNIAWAYAHILKGRDEYFVDTMKGISQEIERRGVHNIPSHQLSSFAWSCCKLGLRDERLFQDIACLLDAGFLQKLTNHSLISLLWALGITDVMKHIQLTIFEQEILKRQVRSFNAIELNTAALAFSRTRYQGRIWEELDAEAIRRSRGKKGK